MRRIARCFVVCSVFLGSLAGCRSTAPDHRVHHRVLGGERELPQRALLLVHATVGDQVRRLRRWNEPDPVASARARSVCRGELEAIGRERGWFEAVDTPDLSAEEETSVREHLALLATLADVSYAQPDEDIEDPVWAYRAIRFDKSLGSGLAFLGERSGVDAALVVVATTFARPGPRPELTSRAKRDQPAGVSGFLVAAVDLPTGDVLWLDRRVDDLWFEPLDDAAAVRARLDTAFDGWPQFAAYREYVDDGPPDGVRAFWSASWHAADNQPFDASGTYSPTSPSYYGPVWSDDWTPVEGHVEVTAAGHDIARGEIEAWSEDLEFEPPEGWLCARTGPPMLSYDGPYLQRVTVKHAREGQKLGSLQAPLDFSASNEELVRCVLGHLSTEGIEILDRRPLLADEAPGAERGFLIRFRRTRDGGVPGVLWSEPWPGRAWAPTAHVERGHLLWGLVKGDQFCAVHFTAPALHYLDRDRPAVEAIVRSVRFR